MRKIYVSAAMVIIAGLILTQIDINDTGLKFLELIKKVRGQRVKVSEINTSNSQHITHDTWSALLSKYVTTDGFVDYEGFLSDTVELQAYLTLLSKNPPSENQTKDYQLSYWINTYNAYTVKLILNNYPIESIKQISNGLPMISSPWDIKFFSIGGVAFDLNTIEHDILRRNFREPRFHFAINCASISCPKLLDEAYTPSKLESQLQDQALYFLNNPTKNEIAESVVRLSQIFDWFAVDFKSSDGNTLSFIQKFVTIDITKAEVSYLDYDWKLNKKVLPSIDTNSEN